MHCVGLWNSPKTCTARTACGTPSKATYASRTPNTAPHWPGRRGPETVVRCDLRALGDVEGRQRAQHHGEAQEAPRPRPHGAAAGALVRQRVAVVHRDGLRLGVDGARDRRPHKLDDGRHHSGRVGPGVARERGHAVGLRDGAGLVPLAGRGARRRVPPDNAGARRVRLRRPPWGGVVGRGRGGVRCVRLRHQHQAQPKEQREQPPIHVCERKKGRPENNRSNGQTSPLLSHQCIGQTHTNTNKAQCLLLHWHHKDSAKEACM